MREQRLKADMSRASKELQYYQEKAEMALKLNKMEERHQKKLKKVEEESEGDAEEEVGKVEKKKLKNFEK